MLENELLHEDDRKRFTVEIVSRTAYLVGVNRDNFTGITEQLQQDTFQSLEANKPAKILRSLCRLRNALMKNHATINRKMRETCASYYTLTEELPQQSITYLEGERIYPFKGNNPKLVDVLVEVNRLISDRVNNIMDLYPNWVNRQYIRDLFIMPGGLKTATVHDKMNQFPLIKNSYPFQVYINMPCEDLQLGNIFVNDLRFLKLLYNWNQDSFVEYSKVTDASDSTKNDIFNFIGRSTETVMIVDCENSDPYKLCAVLSCFSNDIKKKISRIHLFDDINTTTSWRLLDTFTDIPVEHHLTQRIKENKSLVDVLLTAGACEEHYKNGINSFIVVASDSDYWGLLTALAKAEFMMLVEGEKLSGDMKRGMQGKNIRYCFMDDFNTDIEANKTAFLMTMLQSYLDASFEFNLKDLYEEIIAKAYIELSQEEKQQFYDRHVKHLAVELDKDGKARLVLKK